MQPGYTDERAARRQLADFAREIYQRRLGAAGDGNLSVRIGPNRILTTPAGGHKGRLAEEDMVRLELDGRVLGKGRPSSELALHLEAYRQRTEIGAVIHAHPPMALALQLGGFCLAEVTVAETVFACGQVATAPYTTPTTPEVAEVLRSYLRCYDVILMPRHGSVTLGRDLVEAFVRLDALEHSAHIAAVARLLGGGEPLPAPEVAHLFRVAGAAPPGAQPGCPLPCGPGTGSKAAPGDAALVAAVIAALGRSQA
jgi:L-fuculose-phosphate aldolase